MDRMRFDEVIWLHLCAVTPFGDVALAHILSLCKHEQGIELDA